MNDEGSGEVSRVATCIACPGGFAGFEEGFVIGTRIILEQFGANFDVCIKVACRASYILAHSSLRAWQNT